jgi:hypothetical protein
MNALYLGGTPIDMSKKNLINLEKEGELKAL